MNDDYTAPLGLDRRRGARMAFRAWPVFAALSLLFVAFVIGWAIVEHDPSGGEPSASVVLPVLPAAVAAPAPASADEAPQLPDDEDGEIIIRDP